MVEAPPLPVRQKKNQKKTNFDLSRALYGVVWLCFASVNRLPLYLLVFVLANVFMKSVSLYLSRATYVLHQ